MTTKPASPAVATPAGQRPAGQRPAGQRPAGQRLAGAEPPAGAMAIAQTNPVARLMVDVPLPHLDRPFDYLVPAELDTAIAPGHRVRVRFAGRLVDGYVLERVPASDHAGRLARIERVVGAEPVLTPATTRLFRAVADRWAGSFVDVVRLGVPARHARGESASAAGRSARPADPARGERVGPLHRRRRVPHRAGGRAPGPGSLGRGAGRRLAGAAGRRDPGRPRRRTRSA